MCWKIALGATVQPRKWSLVLSQKIFGRSIGILPSVQTATVVELGLFFAPKEFIRDRGTLTTRNEIPALSCPAEIRIPLYHLSRLVSTWLDPVPWTRRRNTVPSYEVTGPGQNATHTLLHMSSEMTDYDPVNPTWKQGSLSPKSHLCIYAFR